MSTLLMSAFAEVRYRFAGHQATQLSPALRFTQALCRIPSRDFASASALEPPDEAATRLPSWERQTCGGDRGAACPSGATTKETRTRVPRKRVPLKPTIGPHRVRKF